MFEPERLKKVHNKTYIMQHPQYNNCMIIALFNAVLDDNPSFDLKELFKEEKRLNDKYEIHKRGTRIELLGGIAWEYGYDVIIHFKHATSQLFNFKNYYNKGDKILRLESWNIYDNDNLSKSEKRRSKKIKKYMNDFLNKYQLHKNKIKERKLITNCSGFGAHLFFIKNIQENNAFYGINYGIGINSIVEWENKMYESQIITLRKRI